MPDTTTALAPTPPAPGGAPRPPRDAAPRGTSLTLACSLLASVFLGGAVLALAPGQNPVDSWGFSVFPNVLQSPFLRLMSDLGLAPVTIAVAVVAAVVGRRHPRRALACLVGPAVAVGGAELLKILVGRRFEGALCWPSGTTAAVTASVTVVALVLNGRARLAAVLLGAPVVVFEVVALVAFRWHYLSDALGGADLGVASVLFVDAVLHRLRFRLRVPAR